MEEYDETRPLIRNAEGSEGRSEFTLRRAVVLPCLVLYFFSLGIFTYTLPEYVQNYFKEQELSVEDSDLNACSANKSDPAYINSTHAQQQSALWLNYFIIASCGPAIISTLVWTSYTDVIGRRFLFILCSSGLLVKLTVITVVIYFKANLVFIVGANIIDALTGSTLTMFAVLFSFAADVTKSGTKRTMTIVLTECIVGITVTIATFSTGYFIRHTGFFYPMLTSVILLAIAVIMIAVFLPETLTNRRQGSLRLFFNYVSAAITLYSNPGSSIRRAKYILLIISFFILTVPIINRGTLETLYQLGEPFCWDATKVGYFGAIKTGLTTIFGIIGIFLLRKCCADDTVAVISVLLTIGSFIVEGFAETDAMLYLVPVLSFMSIVPVPMIRSLMSHLTPLDQQGALFAGIGMIETLCLLVGTLTNNIVYSATITIMHGFVFFLMALISLIGLLVMLAFVYVQRRYPECGNTIIVEAEDMPQDI